MRAVVCNEYGPPESLCVESLPDPTPGPSDVVVDVAYAAVNFPDVLIVANAYQVSVPVPFVPGSEFAGVVSAVGHDVGNVSVGDRVFGAAMHGAFAERVAVPAGAVRRVPVGVPLAEAAGFWVAHSTAYHALRSVGEVSAGDTVVVLGAGGGVGLAAVELGSELGARVIAAASTEAKLAACRERGAADTIDHGRVGLRDALRELAPGGVDVVVDPVGGPLAEQALRALRYGGRFVTVGFASGEIPRIPLNLVLLKGCVVKGFELRTFAQFEPQAARRDDHELLDLLASGRVRPRVESVFALDAAPQALAFVAGRGAIGKVLIRTDTSANGAT